MRSGQNFIHDPKVAGEAEVKAQIKMRFKAPIKGSFMVIRNFSLLQRKEKLTFKSLDSTLSIWNPEINDFNALPQKCSNINQEVPFSMGVNKAILENVIFVHQEESNWPLEDGKAVKQRFDDIFAATKYTKALEEIKKLKNKQQAEAREKRLQLETLKSHRDQANVYKQTIKDSEDSNKAHNKKILMLKKDIEDIDAEVESLHAELRQISLKKDRVSSIKAKYDIQLDEIVKTKEEMLSKYSEEDLNVTLEELQSYQAELTPRLTQQEESMKQIRQYTFEVESEMKKINLAREGIMKSYGKIMGQAESYMKSANSFVAIIDEICTEFQIPKPQASDGTINKEVIQTLVQDLFKQQEEYGSQLNELKAKQRHDELALQETIDSLSAKISGTLEVIRLRKEKVKSNGDKYDVLQRELAEIDEYLSSNVAGKQNILFKELEDAKKALNVVEEQLRCDKFSNAIKEADSDLRTADMNIQQLRSERSKVAALGDSLVRNSIMLQEVAKLREREEKFRSLHGSKVAVTLGIAPSSIPREGDILLAAMKDLIATKESEHGTLSSQHKSVQRIFAEAEADLKSCQSSALQLRNEMKNLEKALQGISDDPFELEEKIKELHLTKDDMSKKVSLYDAYSEIWKKELEHASTHSSCLSCERIFENKNTQSLFIDRKKIQIDGLPVKMSKDQAELQQVQAEIENFRMLEPNVKRWVLGNQISSDVINN